ncbi:MAG TPA: DegT/DnrJ/EryC1/StrS family aminotransferase [Ktedonobacteraceae bacterium]|jgi:perosamine synthetase|nr:DegT/DnrJ/EryC1/StrS family aminotransferase [Ktedonobacteraceae bacterium]
MKHVMGKAGGHIIPISCPLLGAEEDEAVRRVLASGRLAQGPLVAEFERRFAELCAVREAVALSSGTAALYLALLAHGIGPGDEVITSSFSFVATANAVLLTGATPVFVDIEPSTYTLDPDAVASAITPRTKALLPVHLYGHPCDMLRLCQLAAARNLVMIEDACQAHGATLHGRPVGSFGTGCFSFYATKNMTTGEGGMVTTNDSLLAERLRLLRNHGQQERYVHVAMGQNLRMTEIQAAIGLVQLAKLALFTEQRIVNASYLTSCLHECLSTPVIRPGYRHVFHQYTIRVLERRNEWVQRLLARGIEAAVHYPLPIHRQPFYLENTTLYRVVGPAAFSGMAGLYAELPVTEAAAREVLSLPVHPALSREDLFAITQEVLALCA